MAVRTLRRIGPAVGDSLYDRMRARTLHSVAWRPWVDETERHHPRLIIEDGPNLLAALDRGSARLVYGFESDRAFAARFPQMFERLLPRIRKELKADIVRIGLEHAPARAMVEPVLKRLWFAPVRDWLRFELPRGARLPSSAAPRGVRFREAQEADLPELMRIDAACFPATPMSPDGMARSLRDGRALLAVQGKAVTGFCLFSEPEPGEGYINILAVDDQFRGQGLGAALTARACKQLYAAGARRIRLTTDGDNGNAIRLYVRLGFRQEAAGRDYSRPTDPGAIERMRKQGEGIVIRFGGWR